jgi:hypothetical protein
VVVLDSVDPQPGGDGGAAFLIAADKLTPAGTTVVIGAADAHRVAAPVLSRPVEHYRPSGATESPTFPLPEGVSR